MPDLKLKNLVCNYQETLEKVHSVYKFMKQNFFLNASEVLFWANELETKECSPVYEVNVCSLVAGLHNSQTFVKF